MLSTIESVNSAVNNFIWGVPAMICIFGVGLYLSLRTRFLQIRKFPYAIRTTLGRMFRKRDASKKYIISDEICKFFSRKNADPQFFAIPERYIFSSLMGLP